MPTDPRRQKQLFEQALERPPEERAAFLDGACGDDAELRARVDALLASLAAAADFLTDPPPAAAGGNERPGGIIDRYKLLEPIGEGGFGAVWMAEQQEPVRRKVALKVIKLGMDTRQVVARFEAERQALALMDHPNIAKVLDGGITPGGRPYFVMELIKGVPIDEYCDQAGLGTPARLQLFQQVCLAVQHAHHKGVIHRDLKPGNILVTLHDGKPVPKVIDFGIAKATSAELTQKTLFTEFRQLVGTPEYMAPEQAELSGLDVDTRADVYALGVVLYELLTGSKPFEARTLLEKGYLEMLRVIREDPPQKPSTRISTLGEKLAVVASRRRATPASLSRLMRGDLDWIVMQALEKDRDRRYATANDFAADIGRHLQDQPVHASPPGVAYRLRKYVRRHRVGVFAGATTTGALLVGLVTSLYFLSRFQTKVRDFDQLAGMTRYRGALESERDLYPAWPRNIEAMTSWLEHECGPLLSMRRSIETTLSGLRERALPATASEAELDRESHPRYREWQWRTGMLTSLRRAQSIRVGATPLVEPQLSAAQQELAAEELNRLAFERVAPRPEGRQVFGEEALGLALARAALAKTRTDAAYETLDTLAWSLLANGQDAAAQEQSRRALAAAPASQRDEYRGYLSEITHAVEDAGAILTHAEDELPRVTDAVAIRRTWRFAPDEAASRFLHDTLAALLDNLDRLAATRKQAVEQRLAWARRLRDGLTLHHPRARVTWDEVRASLASKDGKYAGAEIHLRDDDVEGLVPIGKNPKTQLWEFYHLRSAWDGAQDPATIEIPKPRDDGSIEVTGNTGIVFVLLPGGAVTIGSQSGDPDAPYYNRYGFSNEVLHVVHLDPFFLARHELTQGQWSRLVNSDEDRYPSVFKGLSHPVEHVDWPTCDTLLGRHGLVLPTESQWEYGCRGGVQTPWCVPVGELFEFANFADATLGKRVAQLPCEKWEDGYADSAPVGSFRANDFGMYDMHGNVEEWCRSYMYYYGTERPGDGMSPVVTAERALRGGCYTVQAFRGTSSFRNHNVPTFTSDLVGLRAARALRPLE